MAFDRVPAEVLLQVAQRLPDLASLYAFAVALPAVYRLLRRYGGDIVEAILSDPSHTTAQTRDLIRLVVLARTTPALPAAWTVDSLVKHFLRPTMMWKAPPDDPCVPPPVPPAGLPLSILGTAARVHHWVPLCLAHYLGRLRDAQTRLRRPGDPGFNYTHGYGPDDAMVPGWQRRCDGVPYDTPVMGPPSWVEEQVVARAFWRLQLFYDLQRAAREGRLDGAWPPDDVQKLCDITLDGLFSQAAHALLSQHQELLTVAEFLQDATGQASSVTTVPAAVTEPASAPFVLQAIPETDDHWTYPPLYGTVYEPQGLRARSQVDLYLTSVLHEEQSPIRGAPARLFRQVGIAIWDDDRLASLGLKNEPRRRGLPRPPSRYFAHYWFQWRSILNQDELRSVDEDLEKREREQDRLNQERFARWRETGRLD
jgi:hypothetical protein